MAAVPSKPKPKILLVGSPLSLNIKKKIEYSSQKIQKQYGMEVYLSVALVGPREVCAFSQEIDMILNRHFAEAWFIGDGLTIPVVETFAFLQEAKCRIRSGAPENSNLYHFLHVQNGIPCGTV